MLEHWSGNKKCKFFVFDRKKYAHCKNGKQWAYKFWDGKPYHMELMKKSEKKPQKSVFLTRNHIHAMRLMNSGQSIQSLCYCPCSVGCSGQECGVFTHWHFFQIAYSHWVIVIILFIIWWKYILFNSFSSETAVINMRRNIDRNWRRKS